MNLPFRLGTTSFVYPGGWSYNVERLRERWGAWIEDIELLFFASPALGAFPGMFPDAQECAVLAQEKRAGSLSYSLHTPLDVSLASLDETRRRASVRAVLQAIEVAQPFSPEVYVVHVYLGDREHDPNPPTDLAGWRRQAARSLRELVASGVASRDLCVETLDYDFRLLEPVIEEQDVSLALDIGHLGRDGRDVLWWWRRCRPRTRVIQWHGVVGTRDHRSLAHCPRDHARRILAALLEAGYDGVLTLEVFRNGDFVESLAVVRSLLEELWG